MAYEDLQKILKNDAWLFKKYKAIYKMLRQTTPEDIFVMPVIKPDQTALTYWGSIYTKRKYDDGSLGSDYLEGDYKDESSRSYISLENLDALDHEILKRGEGCKRLVTKFTLDYNDRNFVNYPAFDALEEELVRKFTIANSFNLRRYPAEVRAVVCKTEPARPPYHLDYYPVAAKIKFKNDETLYFLINLYQHDKAVAENQKTYFWFAGWDAGYSSNPVVFDENRKMRLWRKGLFGIKFKKLK